MSQLNSSGIKTAADGQAYIPSSKRADGSTRKEIRVRPGYKPPEDVEKYVNRSAEAWRTRADGGVPGAAPFEDDKAEGNEKSKNAKRREAARRKKELEGQQPVDATQEPEAESEAKTGVDSVEVSAETDMTTNAQETEASAEQQKKVRNQLKKLRAVRELKSKKQAGEKLSADQLVKISKENELIRDLVKLGFEGSELELSTAAEGHILQPS